MANRYLVPGSGADGVQLWVVTVDGQTVSAEQLALLYPATAAAVADPNQPGHYVLGTKPNDANPDQFTAFGGGTLFVANGLHTGRELFVTDGTQAGTHLVRDLLPAYDRTTVRNNGVRYSQYANVASSEPSGITAVGSSRAVFTASDGVHPLAVFTTDGTEAGTTALTAGGLYSAAAITGFGDRVLFSGVGASGTAQLWVSDGTDAGTHAVAGPADPGRPDPSGSGTYGGGFAVVATPAGGTEAFFAGTTSAGGTELWVTDGTDAGTRQVRDIAAGAASSKPSFVTGFGPGRAIFAADDGVHGNQLWITDGTQAGTTLVATLYPGGDGFRFATTGFTVATVAGQQLAFFRGFDGTHNDPWVTDGTAAGTRALMSQPNAYAGEFTAFDDRMFFVADDGVHGRELMVSDGTVAGTVLFDDVTAGAYGSSPQDLRVLGDQLFFSVDDGAGNEVLWVSNGTLAGTHAVANAPPIELGGVDTQVAPCFAAGTRLAGPDGMVAVEDLREGDRLLNAAGQAVPVVWLGRRRVECARHPEPERVWPVRVRAGAFGPGVPAADVVLSPDHAVFVDGVLIPVGRLANGGSIAQERVARVTYFHVELPLHDVLLAEGLPVESFLDTGNRGMFEDQPGMRLHPDFARLDWELACAPLVLGGAVLQAVVARLSGAAARAA